jgi:DNA-binding CsgD family transcriptional regulator
MTRNDHPTEAEIRALRAYAQTGSIAKAARQTGLAPDTIRHQLRSIRAKCGVHSTAQAIFLLRDKLAA